MTEILISNLQAITQQQYSDGKDVPLQKYKSQNRHMIARKMLRNAYLNNQVTQQLKSQLDYEQKSDKTRKTPIHKFINNNEPENDEEFEIKYLRHTLNCVKKQVAQVDNRLAQRLDFQINNQKLSPYEDYGPINVNSIKYYKESDLPVQQFKAQYNKLIKENQIALAQSKAQRLDLAEKQEELQALIRDNQQLKQYVQILSDGNANLAEFETIQDLTNLRAEYDVLLEVKRENQKLIDQLTEQLAYLESAFSNSLNAH